MPVWWWVLDLSGILAGLSKLEPPKTWTDLFIIIGVVIAATVALTQAVSWTRTRSKIVPAGPKRIFVAPEVTWEHLTGLRKDHTEVASDSLVRPYIGLWFRAVGEVKDVESGSDYRVHLWTTSGWVFARFKRAQWKARLDVLPRGARVTLIGRIAIILAGSLSLEDGELVDDA